MGTPLTFDELVGDGPEMREVPLPDRGGFVTVRELSVAEIAECVAAAREGPKDEMPITNMHRLNYLYVAAAMEEPALGDTTVARLARVSEIEEMPNRIYQRILDEVLPLVSTQAERITGWAHVMDANPVIFLGLMIALKKGGGLEELKSLFPHEVDLWQAYFTLAADQDREQIGQTLEMAIAMHQG